MSKHNPTMKAVTVTRDGKQEAQGALGVSVGHVDASDVDAAAFYANARQHWEKSRMRASTSQGARYGVWIKPEGFGDWEFFRCGARHDPRDPTVRHQRARTMAIYEAFKLSGWVDAPEGTKWRTGSGIEDASIGLYVCLPPEYAAQYRAEKQAAKHHKLASQRKKLVEESADGRVMIEELVGETRSFNVKIEE